MPQPYVPNRIHFRHILLFLFSSGLKIKDAVDKMQQVYPQEAPSYDTARLWFNQFKTGDYSLEDEERSGRPSELDLAVLNGVVESDPYLTTRELSATIGVSQMTIVRGLKALGKVKKLGRWIPHLLTDYDKDRRVDICISLSTLKRTTNWIDQIVTGDEKYVLYSNDFRRAQWVDKDEQPADVAKPELHPKKSMLSVWWGARGLIYHEFLLEGTMITADIYRRQLRELKAAVISKYGENEEVYYLVDNARPHIARSVKQELAGYGWTILPHPPYSPDLAPSDYWLFSHLQRHLDGQNFNSKSDLEKAVTSFLTSQKPEFWKKGIHKLPQLWQQVILKMGEYP
jgi:histone-lysine N-methyltransferase SETMAR